MIVLFPERHKLAKNADLHVPKVVTDVATAEEFQRLFDAGEARNRTDLARRFRLTRARVTQLMNLLKLHPAILAYGKSLAAGTPTRLVTERRLRVLVGEPHGIQLATATRLLPGFWPFIAERAKNTA